MPIEKTPENYSKCQLCGYQGKSKQSIIIHIQQTHKNYTFKTYYDLFFKENKEGTCEVCGNQTKWNGRNYTKNQNRYYTSTCSAACASINPRFMNEKEQKTIEKYGVKHFTQRKDVKDKLRITGKNNYTNSLRKAEKTIINNYGNMKNYHKTRLEKTRQTNLIKYGVNYPLSNNVILNKTVIKGNITSKLHLKIRNFLNLEELGFIKEQQNGRYFIDEINRQHKLILEINGDYIHANPKLYDENDLIIVKSHRYYAKDKWEYDNTRKLELAAQGYIIYEIWESDDLNKIKENIQILLDNQ